MSESQEKVNSSVPTHLKDILKINENKCSEYNAEGKIQCTCGCKNVKLKFFAEEHCDYIVVKKYEDDYGLRIVGVCPSCNKVFDIFDMFKHGYNGFVCKDGKAVKDSDLKEYSCPYCNNDEFEV